MAGIPVSEIPNAPRTGDPVLIERAGPRTTDISGTTRSLLSTPMSTAGVEAQSEAYQNLGAAVSQVGAKAAAVLQDWQQAKAQATDYDSRNKSVKKLDDSFAAYQKNIEGQPDSVVQQEFVKLTETTTKAIQEQPFTPQGRASITAYHQQRMNDAKLFGLRAANSHFVQQGQTNAAALYQGLMQSRRFEDGSRLIQEGQRTGFFSQAQAQALEHDTLSGIQRQDMDTYIRDNPFDAHDYIVNYQKTGQNQHFSLLTADEMANNGIRAQTAIGDLQRQTSDQIDAAVNSGQPLDEPTIRHLAAPARLSQEEVASHIASLREVPVNTPAERANYLRAQSDISTIVAGYDPQRDPGDTYYSSLKRAVRQFLPMADRPAVLQQINERREKGITPADHTRAQAYEQIDSLAASGVLGIFQSGRGEADPERMTRVYSQVRLLKDDFTKFIKSNPDTSPADQKKWLGDRVSNQVILRGARLLRQRHRPTPSTSPANPADDH